MYASAERSELSTLWDELIAGTCKVEGWGHGKDTWSLEVSRRSDAPADGGLRPRDIEILEHALLCGARKLVAQEVGLSCSSIAVIMQSCFHFMGVTCLPSRIPGLLVLAAHARRRQRAGTGAAPRGARRPPRHTISVARPDRTLIAWLAPAEHEVIHLLIEGMSYAEIARERQTSVRTVANQVASGFRRLGVSGRAELLCMLARWGLEPPEPPAQRPPLLAPSRAKRSLTRGLQLLEDARSAPHCHSPSPVT